VGSETAAAGAATVDSTRAGDGTGVGSGSRTTVAAEGLEGAGSTAALAVGVVAAASLAAL